SRHTCKRIAEGKGARHEDPTSHTSCLLPFAFCLLLCDRVSAKDGRPAALRTACPEQLLPGRSIGTAVGCRHGATRIPAHRSPSVYWPAPTSDPSREHARRGGEEERQYAAAGVRQRLRYLSVPAWSRRAHTWSGALPD